MKKQRVAFAIACNKYQSHKWWSPLLTAVRDADADPNIEMVGVFLNNTAGPDFNKNNLVHTSFQPNDGRRGNWTDANRNDIVAQVEASDADWIYWWDDDTAHPKGALKRLLALNQPFASGLYYLKSSPHAPVAYFRNENGSYRNLTKWTHGEIVECDMVGMGCALIHRDVYRDIHDAHDVFLTDNYTAMVVPKDDVSEADYEESRSVSNSEGVVRLTNGSYYRVQRVRPVDDTELAKTDTHFPYYGMMVTQTEDKWFCELAANVGYKPVVDTEINCTHWGDGYTGREHFRRYELVPKAEATHEQA